MKNLLQAAVAIAFSICLAGCATSPTVHTDFDPSQSFDGYKTFAWISDEPMILSSDLGPNPLVARRLKVAIRTTLEEKGFRFVSSASSADFVVAFTVGARDKMDVRSREVVDYYGTHWRWGYDYFDIRRPINFPRTQVTTRQYTEGSLAIDIFDVERKSPVWHGSASKRLSSDEQKGRSAESTREAVRIILSEFPPR